MKVVGVDRIEGESNRYTVKYATVDNSGTTGEIACDFICVCSGLHNTPYIPPMFQGLICDTNSSATIPNNRMKVIHSSQYKD